MISFSCSECGKTLSVKDEFAGKKGKCPHCGQAVLIPREAAAVASRASEDKTVPPRSRPDSEKTTPPTPRPTTVKEASAAGGRQTRSGLEGDSLLDRPEEEPAESKEHYDFLASAQAPDELGRLGSYRVLKVLGAGGMGVVFQAEDAMLKRKVALKAMLPGIACGESARKRFLRKAQAAAAIEHDNIVPIFQVGEDRGVPFLAMPFLKGEPLDQRITREGKLPLADVMRIGRETALGLAAAHAHNLIHRDIKPANLWLEEGSGRVKILDFGLARASDDDAKLTQSGAIIGTPAFMAPEQTRGEVADFRCDLFSLGTVLYLLVTGKRPFSGTDTISTLIVVATENPKPPRTINPAIPAGLSNLVMRLLAKEPAERPESAGKVAEALAALERGGPATGEARVNRYVCPACSTPVKTPQPLPPGKKLKCPGCAAFVVMTPAGEPPTVTLPPKEKDTAGSSVRSGRPAPVEASEPEEAVRPKPRKAKKSKKKSFPLWPAVIGGVFVFLLLAGGGALLYLGQSTGVSGLPAPQKAPDDRTAIETNKKPPEPETPKDKGGGKTNPPVGNPVPEPPHGDPRKVAEWVLNLGGRVMIRPLDKQSFFVSDGRSRHRIDFPLEPFPSVVLRKEGLPGRVFRLETIDLAMNRKVTDSDLKYLEGLPDLIHLCLPGTSVSDLGLEHLTSLKKLQILDTSNTQVSSEGRKRLKSSIPQLSDVRSGGRLLPPDYDVIEWALNMGGKVTVRTAIQLGKPNDTEVDSFETLPNGPLLIVAANLAGSKKVTDREVEGLNLREDGRKLQQFTTLDVSGTAVTDRAMEELREIRALTTLNVKNTTVTPDGVQRLKTMLPKCAVQN